MQPNPNLQPGQQPVSPAEAGFTEVRKTSASTPDQQYDLISILYHSLESAQIYEQYAEDAKRAGDQELAQFFVQTQHDQITCSEKAKQLLSRRLGPSPVVH